MGVHSRVEGFAKDVIERTQVGNNYVNRNMIGAVVGVQPFWAGCSERGQSWGLLMANALKEKPFHQYIAIAMFHCLWVNSLFLFNSYYFMA